MTRPLQVAVRLTGGLGDVLLASTVLERQYAEIGSSEVTAYYHTPEIAEFVFSGSRFVHAVRPVEELSRAMRRSRNQSSGHDLLLYTGHFPRWVVQNRVAFRELASSQFQELVARNEQLISTMPGLVDRHPQLDGFYARWLQRQQPSANYLDGIGWVTGLEINSQTRPFLSLDPATWLTPGSRLTGRFEHPYITIHDGFDNRQKPDAGSATKTWTLQYWTELVRRLKEQYPDHFILQLGAGKSRPIPNVDVQLIGRTALSETAWLLKNAAVHVDTDSGLAHMAYALHTPAVVLFGPTNGAYFGHLVNQNLLSSNCADCWWSTPDWLAKCPRGLQVPACMQEHTPETVLKSASTVLAAKQTPALEASCLHLYDGMSDKQALANQIASDVGLTPAAITEHIVDNETGVYVHASKQWEYVYAVRAMLQQFGGLGGLQCADVGGGRGALAAFLASRGAHVEQYDRDYAWSKTGLSEQGYQRWARSIGYQARFGSIYNLPAPSASYDVVLCISVLEHLPEKTAALRELVRLLKPGGLCILTFDLALEPDRFRDKLRVDVADPLRLSEWIGTVCPDLPRIEDMAAIQESIARTSADQVRGIPEGMTVGGLTLQRASTAAAAARLPYEYQTPSQHTSGSLTLP